MAMEENDVIALCAEHYAATERSERWSDRKERSLCGDDYYAGIQWSAADVDRLASEGRHAVTINHIRPTVDNLCGVERDNRRDINVVPRKGGYEAVATALTALDKHTLDMCNGGYVQSDIFYNGIRTVRGYFKLVIQHDTDPINGQIVLRSRPCLAIREDPTCQAYHFNDPDSGAAFVIDSEWIKQDRIQSLYPDSVEDLKSAAEHSAIGKQDSFWKNLSNRFVGNDTSAPVSGDEIGQVFDYDMNGRWRYLVTETWWKEWVTRTIVADPRTFEIWYLDPAKKADRAKIAYARQQSAQYSGAYFVAEKRPYAILHVARRVGDILLEHTEDPFNGMMQYPIVPFSPYWHNGYEFGVVDNLVGPQDELNRRRVNVLDIIMRQANAGWIVKKLDSGYGAILRAFGGSPGIVIESDKCGGEVREVAPGKMPPHQQLSDISKNDMEEIGGVSGSSRGLEPKHKESGVLYENKVRQGQQTTRIVYDNFALSTTLMAGILTEMIRHTEVYSRQEIMEVVEQENLLDKSLLDEARQEITSQIPPPQMGNPLMMMMQPPEIQQGVMLQHQQALQEYEEAMEPEVKKLALDKMFKLLRSYRTGQYGTIVSDSPSAPTTQMATFLKLDAIAERFGPMFPDITPMVKALLSTSGLPATVRDELLEGLPSNVQQPQAAGVSPAANSPLSTLAKRSA